MEGQEGNDHDQEGLHSKGKVSYKNLKQERRERRTYLESDRYSPRNVNEREERMRGGEGQRTSYRRKLNGLLESARLDEIRLD